jgi:E3 ubiquitin-protein ligase mind-bomb
MAISMERNELYIISELVDGPNLEEFIFFEEDDQSRIKVTPELKDSIGKNCAQAVAYLHALVPPVIHRDIKPANVLVSRQTGVAKLCDMGISKLKELQTLNQTTSGIPGTPSYMAPECLLLNERATVYSDIWSLACTLLELYTGKECWEIDETNTLNDEMPCNMLKRKLQNHDQPSHLESVQIPMKEVIRKCFNYTPSLRPSALDMIAVYNTPNI